MVSRGHGIRGRGAAITGAAHNSRTRVRDSRARRGIRKSRGVKSELGGIRTECVWDWAHLDFVGRRGLLDSGNIMFVPLRGTTETIPGGRFLLIP